MNSALKFTLLENSRSFLAEALHKALLAEEDVPQWKFAIFNMCQAIEISLKERLRREHPALILENVDKGTRTVSPKGAIARLSKLCGVAISAADVAVIENVALWRNEIVHAEFSLNVTELKSAFSVLFGFIRTFHEVVLQENLSDHVPDNLWKEALEIQEYGEELAKRAAQQMHDEGIDPSTVISCPRCGRSSCVLQEDTCRCYVCGSKEDLVECESCHELVPENQTERSWTSIFENEMWEIRICRNCIDAAKDMYIQHLIDLERGK
ncbi:MAG: hypothetical protein ACOY32_01575 [Thermodesulfobacteriota bacterium]